MLHIFGKKKKYPEVVNDQIVQFKISGMHCTSCSMNIDGELEDIEGVKSSKTSYASAVSTVTFDPEKTSIVELKKTISSLGYTVLQQ